MALSLAQASLDVAGEVTHVVRSTATGGSATSMVDAAFPWFAGASSIPPADYYNGGTIWFLSGSRASTTYTSNIVTDWAVSGQQGTATIATGTAVAATDRYAIANKEYPRYLLWEAVNRALDEIGSIDDEDESLTTVANQMDYDIPASLQTAHIKQVWIATRLSTPYYYREETHWRRVDDQISFLEGFQPTMDDYTIRLVYNPAHSELTADSGTIEAAIPRELIKYLGAYYAADARLRIVGNDQPEVAQLLAQKAAEMRMKASRYMPNIEMVDRSVITSPWMRVEL